MPTLTRNGAGFPPPASVGHGRRSPRRPCPFRANTFSSFPRLNPSDLPPQGRLWVGRNEAARGRTIAPWQRQARAPAGQDESGFCNRTDICSTVDRRFEHVCPGQRPRPPVRRPARGSAALKWLRTSQAGTPRSEEVQLACSTSASSCKISLALLHLLHRKPPTTRLYFGGQPTGVDRQTDKGR